MLSRVGDIYAFLFGWPFLRKMNYRLFYLSGRALGLLNYASARISGENYAIALAVEGKRKPVVFDVGANEGQWIAEVLAICPQAQIHAFEPQQKLAMAVAAKYAAVRVNNLGMGDAPGYMDLYDYADHLGSQHASLMAGVIDGIHHGSPRSQRVEIGTIDTYCEQHAIEYIDFLKIDVEGFEFNVLQGSSRMLEENRVKIIQFEFNEMNVVSGRFLDSFFKILPDNFNLYRLLPHGLVPLSPNGHWLNEQFVYQNIIAMSSK